MSVPQPDGTKLLQINASDVEPYLVRAVQELDEIVAGQGRELGELKFGRFASTSDRRIKTDVTDVNNALDVIGRLRAVRFRYNQEYRSRVPGLSDEYFYNFIAQEYREVFPESVTVDADGYLTVDTSAVTPYLVEAVQELVNIINTQKTQIAALEEQVSALRAESRSVDTLTQLIATQQEQINQLLRTVSQILSGEVPP